MIHASPLREEKGEGRVTMNGTCSSGRTGDQAATTPGKAEIQGGRSVAWPMDPRLRGDDKRG